MCPVYGAQGGDLAAPEEHPVHRGARPTQHSWVSLLIPQSPFVLRPWTFFQHTAPQESLGPPEHLLTAILMPYLLWAKWGGRRRAAPEGGPRCSPALPPVDRRLLLATCSSVSLGSGTSCFFGPHVPTSPSAGFCRQTHTHSQLPGNLKCLAQAFHSSKSRLARPLQQLQGASHSRCVLPPSARTQREVLPQTKSNTGTFHIFTGDLFSLGPPRAAGFCAEERFKNCSHRPSPCRAREWNEGNKAPAPEGSPNFLCLKQPEEQTFQLATLRAVSAFIAPDEGGERSAVRWSRSGGSLGPPSASVWLARK